MRKVTQGLRASTLVETLVMMLVAGIVFLSVMDGLTLFARLHTRRSGELLDAGRERDGYFRIVTLLAAADSIRPEDAGGLEIFRSGAAATLELRDSMLIYRAGEFRDTLLTRIAELGLERYPVRPDTVQIGFGRGYVARFPVLSPARRYRITLDEIENGYGYED